VVAHSGFSGSVAADYEVCIGGAADGGLVGKADVEWSFDCGDGALAVERRWQPGRPCGLDNFSTAPSLLASLRQL
jgi:hypothetical protein